MNSDRELFWFDEIDEKFIRKLIPAIASIHNQSAEAKITLWINSNGGLAHCGVAFLDFIKAKRISLTSVGLDRVNSTALLIWAGGKVRKATRNCRFVFHKPERLLNYNGPEIISLSADECRETVADLDDLNLKLCRLLARQFNTSLDNLLQLGEENACLTAQEMKKKGFLHQII